VGQQKAPDFLLDQFWFPGAENHSRPALVRLELIEDKLREEDAPLLPPSASSIAPI
jgi:hypothetical protein